MEQKVAEWVAAESSAVLARSFAAQPFGLVQSSAAPVVADRMACTAEYIDDQQQQLTDLTVAEYLPFEH